MRLQDTPPRFESIEPVLLGPVEDMYWNVDERLAGAFRGAVVVQLDGCIEADFLAAALRRVQHRHPKLRAVIAQGSDGRRRYVFDTAAPPIPFEVKDYEEAEPPWREETRRLLQSSFPSAGPLAAVTVLRSRSLARSELLVAVHHAIADGASAIVIVNDLLSAYADAEAHLDVRSNPVLPVVTATSAAASGGALGRLWVFRRFLRLQSQERRLRATGLPRADNIPPQSQWVHWKFSREDTLALVRRCRKEKTSLSGVLWSSLCCGLMDCLPLANATFKCQFPFSIRDMLQGPAGPVTAEDLGCFVSVMNEFYQVPTRPVFWELARRAQTDLQAFVQHGGPTLYHRLSTSVIGKLLVQAASRAAVWSDERPSALITHYGVLNFRDMYGSLRPQGCTLIFKNDVIGPMLVMEGLVMGHRLNIGLAGDGLEPAFWERLHVAVRGHLDTAVGAQNPD